LIKAAIVEDPMVQIGDKIPDESLGQMTAAGPGAIATGEIFDGKKVVLLGVPGAFTPTCSKIHLPGFVAQADALAAKGVDTIACVSVNDAFVMDAWGQDQGVGDRVLMLADGSGKFAKALGLELDLMDAGLGVRNQRYSMVVDNGVVTHLNVEPGKGCGVSSAESMLDQL
jgi:glutaredoxin/glutathione-dependent peroxiredoxin